MTAEPTRWIAYGARSAHDLATAPPVLPAAQRHRKWVGRCTCGWQSGRRRTYHIAWQALLTHIADGRLAEVLEPTDERTAL